MPLPLLSFAARASGSSEQLEQVYGLSPSLQPSNTNIDKQTIKNLIFISTFKFIQSIIHTHEIETKFTEESCFKQKKPRTMSGLFKKIQLLQCSLASPGSGNNIITPLTFYNISVHLSGNVYFTAS